MWPRPNTLGAKDQELSEARTTTCADVEDANESSALTAISVRVLASQHASFSKVSGLGLAFFMVISSARGNEGLDGCFPDAFDDQRCVQSHVTLGSAVDHFDLGTHAQNGGDQDSAFQHFHEGVLRNGDLDSMIQYAAAFHFGLGTEEDRAEAARWYEKAAIKGSAWGKTQLGVMLYLGDGVAKDTTRAATLTREAAEAGIPDAQANYGYMLSIGDGVARDYERALHWNQQAIDAGLPQGTANLGEMYEYGRGVPLDLDQAERLYREVASQGVRDAIEGLERIKQKRENTQASTTPPAEGSSPESIPGFTPELSKAVCMQVKPGAKFKGPRNVYDACTHALANAASPAEGAVFRTKRGFLNLADSPAERIADLRALLDSAMMFVRSRGGFVEPGVLDPHIGEVLDEAARVLDYLHRQSFQFGELSRLYAEVWELIKGGVVLRSYSEYPGQKKIAVSFANGRAPELRLKLVEMLILQGRFVEATKFANEFLAEFKNGHDAAYMAALFGDALRLGGQGNAAQNVYVEALRLYDSNSVRSRVLLGQAHLYATSGEADSASSTYGAFFDLLVSEQQALNYLPGRAYIGGSPGSIYISWPTAYQVFWVVAERLKARGVMSQSDYDRAWDNSRHLDAIRAWRNAYGERKERRLFRKTLRRGEERMARIANLFRRAFQQCLRLPDCAPDLAKPVA